VTPVSDLTDELETSVRDALAGVLDPCSVFNGTRLSFLDLGMVDRLESPGPGRLVVEMLLDDPVCLYVGQIEHEIRTALLGVTGVTEVEVRFSGREIWTEERATEATRVKFQERRELRRRLVQARSRQQITIGETL
jgi:metal-sulfur cluster biosynthetic enzyme